MRSQLQKRLIKAYLRILEQSKIQLNQIAELIKEKTDKRIGFNYSGKVMQFIYHRMNREKRKATGIKLKCVLGSLWLRLEGFLCRGVRTHWQKSYYLEKVEAEILFHKARSKN